MKENILKVKSSKQLLPFLIEAGYAKNKAKSLLKYKNVWVNGKIGKYNQELKINDQVTITNERRVKPPFEIMYEDQEFLVINKKPKLLTVSPNNQEKNLYNLAKTYLKKKNAPANLFVLHRLDKETSGIVVFCKNKDLTEKLQENWNSLVKERKYTAVIEGKMQEKEGTFVFYLQEQGEKNVLITDKNHGKKAITQYKVRKENQEYSLLEIYLETGRKNQIRATFSHIGRPVVGDKKYFSKKNPIRRVALIANGLEWVHPDTKKTYKFALPIPKEFKNLVK